MYSTCKECKNAIFAIANPAAIKHVWRQIDLMDLFKYNHGHFFVVTLVMGIIAVLKAWLFFLIISISDG